MPKSLKLALLGTFLSVTVVAQQAPVALPAGPMGPEKTLSSAAGRAAQGSLTLIRGTAVDSDNAPLPNAPVRLRNLQLKEIEQVTKSNEGGEFTFIARPEVPYVAEIADPSGRILAVGDVITAQAGDVATTVVAIPARLPPGIFGETAGTVVSAANAGGTTIVEGGVVPLLSPER